MQTTVGFNHLINKRIQSGFCKNKDIHSRIKKNKESDPSPNLEEIIFNQSVDVKAFMPRQRQQILRNRPSNTIHFQSEIQKGRRQNNIFFANSKREFQKSNVRNVKLVYGSSSPHTLKTRINIYSSHKTIKEKKKRLSFSTSIRDQTQRIQGIKTHSPTVHTNTKQIQTLNIQKHMIIAKYDKVKLLLQEEKFSQASIYLRQILPYIEDKNKKKQLYFLLIAAMIKSGGKIELVENYIVECLDEFPNYYDIYVYWAKLKVTIGQIQEAIEICEKAISIQKKKSEAYSQLANIYLSQQSYSEAFQILHQGFLKATDSTSIPARLIENYSHFNLSLTKDISLYLSRIQSNCGKKSTEMLYLLGFIEYQSKNYNEALIYFLESLKYNSNRTLATKSLQNIIKIHISKKDFYAACYDLHQARHLNIDNRKIQKYETFLQGVNFVMKKKNEEGIRLLSKIKQSATSQSVNKHPNSLTKSSQTSFIQNSQIFSLTIQYLAYAYFKLGNHKQAIKCYKMLEKIHKSLDNTSKYNMLLAEGIVIADFYHDFQKALTKFAEAKKYLRRVEPFIYQAVVSVQRKVHQLKKGFKKKVFSEPLLQQQFDAAIIQALNFMQEGYHINSSSSNLLYHRTILHLYFSSIKTAMNDINVCIQKAEQNLPKYFYLRGICFACSKNLKKAINQFSISISLSKQFSISYLQRAKCYFLSGETQLGFQDLKVYMEQCPNDYLVHKWIGDLLFQGTSYHDSVKAYNQMGENITLQALCMRLRAEFRVGTIKQVGETWNKIRTHQDFDEQQFGIDIAAFNLLWSLMTQQVSHEKEKYICSIQRKIKQLNQYLQSDVQKSKIFNLVDSMCLVGIGYFWIQKYFQAYESFLLLYQFFKSNSKKIQPSQEQQNFNQSQSISKDKINTEIQEQNLDLKQEDIYYNLFVCLLSMKDVDAIKKLCDEEMMASISNKTQKKVIEKILELLTDSENRKLSKTEKSVIKGKKKDSTSNYTYLLEPRVETPFNFNYKKLQIHLVLQKCTLIIKTSMVWSSYHGTNDNLSFTSNAKKLVQELHAGYIDNMPQGPWIRRNQFGVLFTDNILDEDHENSFLTTNRNPELQQQEQQEQEQYDDQYLQQQEEQDGMRRQNTQENQNINERKNAFLRQMKLDLKIENKLNKIIKKTLPSQ